MQVSREDAFGMLSKWRTESSPICGLLMTKFCLLKFGGCITDLVPNGFTVTQYPGAAGVGRKIFDLTVDLRFASDFNYGDPREAPEHVRKEYEGKVNGLLNFDLPDGAACAIFEFETTTPAQI
jgi:hypothetical protein